MSAACGLEYSRRRNTDNNQYTNNAITRVADSFNVKIKTMTDGKQRE